MQGFRLLGLQHGGVGQEHPVLLPDVLQGFGKIVVILHGRTIRITDQLTDVWYLKANITEHGICENINIKIIFHRVEVFLISGEDEGVVRLSIDTQRHAEHFIPALIPPRLCRRKIAAVDPHIRRQQTAGVGDKSTVPGIIRSLRINKDAIISAYSQYKETMPHPVIIVKRSPGLSDERIFLQHRPAELVKLCGGKFDHLLHHASLHL